jgi:predicted secreted protein
MVRRLRAAFSPSLEGKPMKSRFSVMLAAVAAAIFATAAAALPSGAAPRKAPGTHPMDCAKAKDKARCESLNKDIEACKDKTDDEWRDCMHRPTPAARFTPPKPRDCAKARNKERCEAHGAALETCKDKTTRAEHRRCMKGQTPAPGKP